MPAGMRDDCEPPASRGRKPGVGRSDGDPGQDRGERDLDFKLGERGTDAAVGAAAERQPGVGLGLAAHERAVGAARAVSRSPSHAELVGTEAGSDLAGESESAGLPSPAALPLIRPRSRVLDRMSCG